MALATLRALKSPGATPSVDRRRVVRQTTCGKPRRLSRDDATSTEHGTEHSEAGHDVFRLAWHIAQRSYRHAAAYSTESGVSWLLTMLPTMLGQGHGPHDGTRTGCRVLIVLWEEARCGVSGAETCLACC